MKKIITLLLLSFIIISCGKQTKEENYKEQIKVYFKESMHDPDSYELESFNLMANETTIPIKILWKEKKRLME